MLKAEVRFIEGMSTVMTCGVITSLSLYLQNIKPLRLCPHFSVP